MNALSKIIVLISLLFLTTQTTSAAEKPLNILMLTVDDMNCDSIGVFGCKVPETTPNLNKFAQTAMRFNHAHVHASSCVPSRNIVMTGRYLYNSGIEGFYAVPSSIKKNPTIPEFLKDNGYFIMIRGKESHTMPYHPFPKWDIDFGDGRLKENSRHPDSFYKYTKEGIEAAKKAGKPFYYNININDPHLALYNWKSRSGKPGLNRQDIDNPPSRIYKPEEMYVHKFLPDTPLVREELTAYYSTVRRADDSVGQIMKALKETGSLENTVVIFFSDHGMPFPFAKTANYYHSTKTPLMIRWPNVTKPGHIDNDHVVGTIDLFPTINELLKLSKPDGLDGRSLSPILHGKKQENRDYVYTMYEENVGGNRQPTRSVISKDYGYIVNIWSDGERKFATATRGMASTREIKRLAADGDTQMQHRLSMFEHRVPEEFYHYAKDPDGINNLIFNSKHKKQINQFRKQTIEFMKQSNDPLLKIYRSRDDEKVVQTYLQKLDEESKARKQQPEIYRRGGAKKKAKNNKKRNMTEEEKARAAKRRKKRLDAKK